MFDRDFDHGAEVVVVFSANRTITWIDAVLGESGGAVRVFGEELVAVVVEVANDGRVPALGLNALDDVGAAAAAASLLTVMRTSSEPARASAAICWSELP
jgi:hypothetical protein